LDVMQHQSDYLLQNLSLPLYTCDLQGHIIFYNKEAVLLWGAEPIYEKDRWFGACELYTADDLVLPPENSPVAIAVREQRPIKGVETIVKQPDGSKLWFLHHASPLFNINEELIGALVVLTDITEQKNINFKLAREEADASNFAKQQTNLVEEERSRIAKEIHDDFGQQLAGIKMSLSSLVKSYSSDKDAKELVKTMINEVDHTMQSLRKFATELRPGILDTLGVTTAIEWLIEEFEKKTGIKAGLHINVKDSIFERSLSTYFFRICQEALTNISKHAQATEVNIQVIQTSNELKLIIADNGKGISNERDNPFSFGIPGMRQRAKLAGARLSIISEADSGTIITLTAKINGE